MKRRWFLRSLIVALTVAPYFVARLLVPAWYRYLWIFPPYPEDMLSYMAWVRQFADGHLLGSLKYTTVPHAAFFFNPFFLVTGWVAGLTRLDAGLALLLMKTIGVFVFLLAFEKLLTTLRLDEREQVAAMLMMAFASGVGGLLALHSADVWIPEVSTGWSLLWNPLYPWSLALTVATFVLMREALELGQPPRSVLAGLAAGVLALTHPYHLPLLFIVVAVDAILERRRDAWRYLAFMIAAFVPLAIYPAWLATGVDILRGHSLLGAMPSPALWSYLAGLGVPLVMAAFSWRRAKILAVWIGCALVAAYAPVWFQRKLIFSVHIPVAILAGISAVRLQRRAPAFLFALVPLLVATPLVLTLGGLAEVSKPDRGNPFAISAGRYQALEFLREHTSPEEVVFADLSTMRLIPAVAGNRVPFGHWAQTVDRKEQTLWNFEVFGNSGLPLEERQRLFSGHGIDYVMAENSFRRSALLEGWTPVFANRDAVIFQRPLTAPVTAATIRGSR